MNSSHRCRTQACARAATATRIQKTQQKVFVFFNAKYFLKDKVILRAKTLQHT